MIWGDDFAGYAGFYGVGAYTAALLAVNAFCVGFACCHAAKRVIGFGRICDYLADD